MDIMRLDERAPKIERKTAEQKARIFLARKLGIGSVFTRAAVEAEISDRHNPELWAQHPSPKALLELYERVSKAATTEDRYEILAEPVAYPPENDNPDRAELWFDYIEELTSKDIIQGIAETALERLPAGKQLYERAADLGGGTGFLSSTLLGKGSTPKVAESVTLVDQSPALIKVADERYGPDLETVLGDVTQMPFPDETFDLMTSSGLVYSLEPEQQAPYFREVSRLLQSGGLYLDGDYSGSSRAIQGGRTFDRHTLQFFIAMAVSREYPFDPLDFDEFGNNPQMPLIFNGAKDYTEFFEQFGLKLSYKEYADKQSGNNIRIRILEKTT